ncbi:hypothetical protein V6N12_030360 [Hibiscus sabdariffa]|uniref:Uncharacterized protein n=1 Tax=Hibiscus sabdariffa TaxID=183260 RepID=A0ABR2C104_9ROSI
MEMAMASHDSITITVQDPPAPLENTADSSKEDEAGISQPSDIAQTRIPQIFEFLPKAGDHLLRTQARWDASPHLFNVFRPPPPVAAAKVEGKTLLSILALQDADSLAFVRAKKG